VLYLFYVSNLYATILLVNEYSNNCALVSAQIWPVCNNGITQFYLPPTHEPYPPLLPSREASSPFGWYSLRAPTKG